MTSPVDADIPARLADMASEQVVLGNALLWPSTAAEFRAIGVRPDLFFAPAHRATWYAIERALDDGLEPDLPTVRRMLGKLELLPEIGPARLCALADVGTPQLGNGNREAAVAHLEELARARRFAYFAEHAAARVLDDPGALDVIVAEAQQFSESSAVPSATLLVDDVAVLEAPVLPSLVDGLLAQTEQVMLAGGAGEGKTTLAVGLAASVAADRPFLGRRIADPGPVVYVPLEGRAAAVSRLLAWKALHRIPQTLAIGVHFYAGDLQLDSASALGRLVAAAKPIRPRLVVIDTLSRASAGLDENSPEMNRAIAGLDRLRAALGCAVLVLHHTGKSGATERGHSVIRGAIDALWLMSLADDVITISCAKARNAEPFDPIPLRRIVSPAGVVLELASAVLPAEELSPTQRRILDTIEGSFGDGGATVRDLQDVLPEIPRPSLYRALKTLTDNGHLVHAGPRYEVRKW